MTIHLRNSNGMTLPFALILTFIFSALVAVSYLFVSVNVQQMQSGLLSTQAIAIAEGINERVKARLNTKSKIQPSQEQEAKLKTPEEETGDEEVGNEEADFDDDFDEETETFDEYYADEVIKISRYITFREPLKKKEPTTADETSETQEDQALRPEANVEKIGDIVIPRGTVLNKGIMIIVFKDAKLDLKLKDITSEETKQYRPKLPVPFIKSLIPNYSEANTRSHFAVNGENLPKTSPSFTNKDIQIEDIKGGPSIDFLVGMDVMPGLTRFFWGTAQAEFYVIPSFDGGPRPVISKVSIPDKLDLLEIKAGKILTLTIDGIDLFLNKSLPVVIPDIVGIIPKVKDANNKQITVSLNITKNAEPGVHTLIVATEGGLSNSYLFNILPPEKAGEELGANTATYTSSLTLLNIRVIENLLPLIDEEEETGGNNDVSQKNKKDQGKTKDNDNNTDDDTLGDESEIPESKKLSPFANADLETSWLLETTCMIGKITKTVSEVIHREIPNLHAAIITNGVVNFEGGGYQVIGATTSMATLAEPTYLSNTVLTLAGPEEKKDNPKDVPQPGRAPQPTPTPQTSNFTPGSLLTVYKGGEKINELDYGIISKVGTNIIELMPPGLMGFHYEGDDVFQFIPPIISKEKVEGEDAEKHTVPKEFSISLQNTARFREIFKSNLDQFSELADLYTNELDVPKDEFGLPVGYMGISYIDGTPVFNENNVLSGKGILIVDTRADNAGRPEGTVEINGDSRNPVDFTGIIYIHGNLRITGNVNINGALIVDNNLRGRVEFANNSVGRVSYDERAIRQTLVNMPFTTKPGTVMISNKSINLENYVQSGKKIAQKLGASSSFEQTKTQGTPQGVNQTQSPESALIETTKAENPPQVETIRVAPASPNAEKELIELF